MINLCLIDTKTNKRVEIDDLTETGREMLRNELKEWLEMLE